MPTTLLDPEHDALRDTVRRFSERHLGGPDPEAPPDDAAWEAAGALGLLAAHVSPGADAAGDLRAALVVAEELGRFGAGGAAAALLAHAHAALPLLAAAEAVAGDVLEGAAAGTVRLALGVGDLDRDGDGHLSGRLRDVPGAGACDLLLVASGALPADAPVDALHVVDPRAANVAPAPGAGLAAAAVADVTLVATPATVLPPPAAGWRGAVADALAREGVMLAAAAVADAAACWEDARAYAVERQAFGRPIGRFQAVRHLLAEAETLVVASRQLVHDAVWALDVGTADAAVRVAHARRFAGSACARVTDACLQVHGGAGYTLDLPVQRSWRDRRTPWRGVAPGAEPVPAGARP